MIDEKEVFQVFWTFSTHMSIQNILKDFPVKNGVGGSPCWFVRYRAVRMSLCFYAPHTQQDMINIDIYKHRNEALIINIDRYSIYVYDMYWLLFDCSFDGFAITSYCD